MSSAREDYETVLDFVLKFGAEGCLPCPDEGGSGDIAYKAAVRLKKAEILFKHNDRLPKAERKLSIELTPTEANAIMVMLDSEIDYLSDSIDLTEWELLDLKAYKMLAFHKFKTWYKENV